MRAVRPPRLGAGRPPLVDTVSQRGQEAHGRPHAHAEHTMDHGGSPRTALGGEAAAGEYKLSARAGAQRPPSSREPAGAHMQRLLRLPALRETPSGSVGGEAEVGAAKTPWEF